MPIGLGESNEAPYTLRGPIPAGTWHLVGDGENIGQTVQVRFDIIWRVPAGAEVVLASVTHTFDPGIGVAFATDLAGIAAPAQPGDELVLRFSTIGGDAGASYTPNGDGALVGASIPSLTLPHD